MRVSTLWASCAISFLSCLSSVARAQAEPPQIPELTCQQLPAGHVEAKRRVVCADVAAFDHMLVYNRFGSYNPKGMVFALRRDITSASVMPTKMDALACDADTGTDKSITTTLEPGAVRYKDCKRPRPLVLRANEQDLLHVRVSNLLQPETVGSKPSPDFSKDFCQNHDNGQTHWAEVWKHVQRGDEELVKHGEADCKNVSVEQEAAAAPTGEPEGFEWPRTRGLSFAVEGLIAIADPFVSPTANPDRIQADLNICRGLQSIAPGKYVDCYYLIDRTGPYFFSSKAAPAGGEGDGGSITHGLFGAVVVEEQDSKFYRSQVSAAAFDAAWPKSTTSTVRHARQGAIDYEKVIGGIPVLNMLRISGTATAGSEAPVEIIHSDLNAVIDVAERLAQPATATAPARPKRDASSFREFSVFFHDELKSFYTRNFRELAEYGQLAGVRDGFAINYGASGMGALLLANRKGIGPAKNCVECLYEEFFLSSWANGDPALLERYSDDPSNVHHSYLNDQIKYRNFHAGPKETHVFHLHAHQWFAGNDGNRGSYLDSQTVAPQQGFTYNIYSGGREDNDHGGSGNRNRTVGDSIFHCHLYPHFAQGMWELWRVHDVLEDGSRRLPDGQGHAGLSVLESSDKTKRRKGSVDLDTGGWIDSAEGTPIPALVPLPRKAAPVLPSYADPQDAADTDALTADNKSAMPGYPFYIGGKPGHRPPQAPMDIARSLIDEPNSGGKIVKGSHLDAGLPRHVFADNGQRKFPLNTTVAVATGIATPERERQQAQTVAKILMRGDMTVELHAAQLNLLDYDGTTLEKSAMGFHYNGKRWSTTTPIAVNDVGGNPLTYIESKGGYHNGTSSLPAYMVNGAPPKPGSPFADPCGAAKPGEVGRTIKDPLLQGLGAAGAADSFHLDKGLLGFRRYAASAVQLDLVTNRAGWHDPQARINVLTANSDAYKVNTSGLPDGVATSPYVSAREEPFYFRAYSGECIEFRHTNETPKDLELDDFQVRTPTDVIGQHIHLVKFDVTSSDGSGNGFNYEDGTLAADEIAARICAAKSAGQTVKTSRALNEVALLADASLCVAKNDAQGNPVLTEAGQQLYVPADKAIWRRKRSENPHLFQTTAQRWFADPILSDDGEGGKIDRTMRTVFSHDHFGPSSIQQHGFYTALVVEPSDMKVCPGEVGQNAGNACANGSDLIVTDLSQVPAVTTKDLTGVHRIIASKLDTNDRKLLEKAAHKDYREFAIAIADFSTLYDPRDSRTVAEITAGMIAASKKHGLEMLACEAKWHNNPAKLAEICGSHLKVEQGASGPASIMLDAPAWSAAGHLGDTPHQGLYKNFVTLDSAAGNGDAQQLLAHLLEYRRKAALTEGDRLASPVNPPVRPESISVDHHDPYLVNYRGEPVPLRMGTKHSGVESPDCALQSLPPQGLSIGISGIEDHKFVSEAKPCSIVEQRKGEKGDMSNVLLSTVHGDPATRIVETYSGDRTMVRLIQGAQEVQHMFNVEGYSWKRNIDQNFPQKAPVVGDFESKTTQRLACNRLEGVKNGRPLEYDLFIRRGVGVFEPGGPAADPLFANAQSFAFFSDLKKAYARCNNVEGIVTAQEMGISEHFEIKGVFRQNVSLGALRVNGSAPQPNAAANAMRRSATDYVYDFGTVDALWNGAWGLLRVYSGDEAKDYTACLRDGKSPQDCSGLVKNRLLRIEDVQIGSLSNETLKPQRSTQIIGCPIDAPRVEASVAAIEASKVYGSSGMRYGKDMYDPDGLMLVAIDPAIVKNELNKPSSRQRLETMISSSGHEPYVLRVKAGECVDLTIVNLLQVHPTAHPSWPGLKDEFGDARMPAITTLNVDPAYHTADGELTGSRDEIEVTSTHRRRSNIRPSARLALRFPLPTLNQVQSIAMPFGVNATGALMPAGQRISNLEPVLPQPDQGGYVRRQASVETVTFYAGKAFLDVTDEESEDLRNMVLQAFKENLLQSYQTPGSDPGTLAVANLLAVNPASLRLNPADGADTVELLGKSYAVTVAKQGGGSVNLLTAIQSSLSSQPQIVQREQLCIFNLWDRSSQKLLSEKTTWHPYAFGALPIKSFGDIISHGTHGLLGAVDVVPRDWIISSGRRALSPSVALPSGARDCLLPQSQAISAQVVPEPRINAGQGLSSSHPDINAPENANCALIGSANCHKVREFVLFVQDGLNLWDQGTKRKWRYSDGGLVRSTAGMPAGFTADCDICDDSYDLGDHGMSYHSSPYYSRLRPKNAMTLESNADVNNALFPSDFFMLQPGEQAAGSNGAMARKTDTPIPVLRAVTGEEVHIRVLQPNGRARQHAFVAIAQDYEDLFPSFGFPHSALMSPGKTLTASLVQPVKPGCYLIVDGPAHLAGGGIWGLLDVLNSSLDFANPARTSCRGKLVQP